MTVDYVEQTITLPVKIPRGWTIVAFRCPEAGETYLDANRLSVKTCLDDSVDSIRGPRFIVIRK